MELSEENKNITNPTLDRGPILDEINAGSVHDHTKLTVSGHNSLHSNQSNHPDLFTVEGLKLEVERLNRELDKALQERSTSAAYGLELLNEKVNLQEKYDSLEAKHEQTKLDLQEIREAFNKSRTDQRLSATTGIEQEERLLNESAALEASFTTTIQEIERELKNTRIKLGETNSEKESLAHEREGLIKKIEFLEEQRKVSEKQHKLELGDLRDSNTKLFTEKNELEGDNVILQKKVTYLERSQIEFESSKHDNQRLREALDVANKQLEDFEELQKINEREKLRALDALQNEIEQKKALKKELDKRNSTDSLVNWSSFAALKGSSQFSGHIGRSGPNLMKNNQNVPKEENTLSDEPIDSVKSHHQFSDNDEAYNLMQDLDMPSLEGSLFDEVHLTEIKKLQKTLDDNEDQRHQLNCKIKDLQHKLDSRIKEVGSIEKKLNSICSLVKDNCSESIKSRIKEERKINDSDDKDNDEFKLIYAYLNDILVDIKSHQEMSNIIMNSKQNESRLKIVEDDIQLMLNLFDEFQNNVILTHEQLMTVSEEIDSVYNHVCQLNGEQPKRVILKGADSDLLCQDSVEAVEQERLTSKYEAVRSRYSNDDQGDHRNYSENMSSKSLRSYEINKLVETVRDQLKYLREALERQLSKNQPLGQDQSETDKTTANSSIICEGEDLATVERLKSLLHTKEVRLKHLRNYLRVSSQTAEVSLGILKSKYEKEKGVVTETMDKLRRELKALKEDAATFASLRSMFSNRCEELSATIDDLTSRLAASEQEKNTLNSILRMAIEQKVMLTQKLEAMEMDREGSQLGANCSATAKDGHMPGQNHFRSMARRASGRNLRQSRSMRISGNRRVD